MSRVTATTAYAARGVGVTLTVGIGRVFWFARRAVEYLVVVCAALGEERTRSAGREKTSRRTGRKKGERVDEAGGRGRRVRETQLLSKVPKLHGAS